MPVIQKPEEVVGVIEEAKTDQAKAIELILQILRIQANRLKLDSERLNRVVKLIEKLQASLNYYWTCHYLVKMSSGSFY